MPTVPLYTHGASGWKCISLTTGHIREHKTNLNSLIRRNGSKHSTNLLLLYVTHNNMFLDHLTRTRSITWMFSVKDLTRIHASFDAFRVFI